jgi:hypothetical protein
MASRTERKALHAQLTAGGYATSRGHGSKVELNDQSAARSARRS